MTKSVELQNTINFDRYDKVNERKFGRFELDLNVGKSKFISKFNWIDFGDEACRISLIIRI